MRGNFRKNSSENIFLNEKRQKKATILKLSLLFVAFTTKFFSKFLFLIIFLLPLFLHISRIFSKKISGNLPKSAQICLPLCGEKPSNPDSPPNVQIKKANPTNTEKKNGFLIGEKNTSPEIPPKQIRPDGRWIYSVDLFLQRHRFVLYHPIAARSFFIAQ